MEQKEKEQKNNEEKKDQFGKCEPSARMEKIMMKMMKEMCSSNENESFDCESMMRGMKCCSKS